MKSAWKEVEKPKAAPMKRRGKGKQRNLHNPHTASAAQGRVASARDDGLVQLHLSGTR